MTRRVLYLPVAALAAAVAAQALASGAPEPGPAAATGPGPVAPAGPAVDIRIETDPLVECHFFLREWTGPSEKPVEGESGDMDSETGAYTRARDALKDQAVFQWFESLVVEGPDPSAVRQQARTLPQGLDTPANRTSIDMLVEALASAYPKFVKAYWPNHQIALNRGLVETKKRFTAKADELGRALMEKMAFRPIGGPVRIFGVIRAGAVSAWGKARGGYFTVVGVANQSSDSFLETAVHEATHLIDSMQPGSGSWMLKDVRLAIMKDAPPAAVDTFIHGLVAFNAGELVTRHLNKKYVPVGLLGPGMKETYQPYVAVYEAAWTPWLDGTKGRGETVAKLASGFRATLEKKAAPGAAPPAPAKKG